MRVDISGLSSVLVLENMFALGSLDAGNAQLCFRVSLATAHVPGSII